MKRIHRVRTIVPVFLFLAAVSFLWADNPVFETYTDEQFRDYWFADKAELTHYSLTQARYGELREGSAMLIFVTEPMNTRLQVKADPPYEGKKIKEVLKLNYTKNFYTGIYPYSVMSSIFTPIERGGSFLPEKLTMSIQEWCGQVYAQLNLGMGRYKGKTFSYFEKEADRTFSLKNVMTEDGLWNLARISPNDLPVGDFQLIPSLALSRLLHFDLRPERVKGKIELLEDETALYTLDFIESDRTLKIQLSRLFPYEIAGWEETYVSGRGAGAATLTTQAKRVERVNLDYWKRNSEADSVYRNELGF